MTKYVLNSGGIKNHPALAKKYFAEVFRGLGTTPRLLVCCFAQPREDWEEKYKRDVEKFPSFSPEGIVPQLELAFPETFEEQIRKSDALYLHGGDDHLLLYWLKKFSIPKIWEGKVVATSSASSNVLCSHFWICDWRQCMDGLGIFPIKFIAHYDSNYGANDSRGPVNWKAGYADLEAFGDTALKIYAMKEGEFAVFEK